MSHAGRRRHLRRVLSDGSWHGDRETWRFVLAAYVPYLATLNLLWEVVKLPLYALWTQAEPIYIAYAVLHCTAGDVLIGSGALFAALIAAQAGAARTWPWARVGVAAVVFGMAYTGFSERMNTIVRANWFYSESMPVLPFLPIGLSPLLQWLIVPPVALALARRRVFTARPRPALNLVSGDEE